MRHGFAVVVVAVLFVSGIGNPSLSRAANYDIDPAHAAVNFKISHLGLSWTFGRFNDLSGQFAIDAGNPEKSSFALTVKVDSLDTANKKRDGHLLSPDFFNSKQFPLITFKSTSVKPIEGGYEVAGELTLHGVAKTISFPLKGGKSAEFPKGTQRTGFTTELIVKRSDYEMDKMAEAIGNDVHISISFEGVLK